MKAKKPNISKEKIGTTDTHSLIDYLDFDDKLKYLNKALHDVELKIYNKKIDIVKADKHGRKAQSARLAADITRLNSTKKKLAEYIASIEKEMENGR